MVYVLVMCGNLICGLEGGTNGGGVKPVDSSGHVSIMWPGSSQWNWGMMYIDETSCR